MPRWAGAGRPRPTSRGPSSWCRWEWGSNWHSSDPFPGLQPDNCCQGEVLRGSGEAAEAAVREGGQGGGGREQAAGGAEQGGGGSPPVPGPAQGAGGAAHPRPGKVPLTPSQPPLICPRFVVARSGLAAGTVLLAEEPLGWALEVERTGTHCQHCLGLVTVIVPCPACVSVAFCSHSCKEVGWQRLAVLYSRPGGIYGEI